MNLRFRQDPTNPLLFICESPLGPSAHQERLRIFNQQPVGVTREEGVTALEALFSGAALKQLYKSEQGKWLRGYPETWRYDTGAIMDVEVSWLKFTDPGIAALFKMTFL